MKLDTYCDHNYKFSIVVKDDMMQRYLTPVINTNNISKKLVLKFFYLTRVAEGHIYVQQNKFEPSDTTSKLHNSYGFFTAREFYHCPFHPKWHTHYPKEIT